MTYGEMRWKIFRYHYKSYLLYFICCGCMIAGFQVFAGIFMNSEFMNPEIVTSYISSDIYAPSAIAALLSLFFIPYSHGCFNRQLKKDYAVFLSLGLDARTLNRSMIGENALIAAASLAAGLAAGGLLSYGFYFYIIHVLHVDGLHMGFNPASYAVTAGWFILLYAGSIAWGAYADFRQTIAALLKESIRARKGMSSSKLIFLLGWVLEAAVIAYLFFWYDADHNNNLAVCFAIGTIGMLLIIFHFMAAVDFLKTRLPRFYYKNLFFFTDLAHRFGSTKKIIPLTAVLLGLAIFFQVWPFAAGQITKRDVEIMHPYQIAYPVIDGMNRISEQNLHELAEENHAKIIKDRQIDFLSFEGNSIFSAEKINQLFHKDYQVEEGTAVTVFQYPKEDGRAHRLPAGRGLGVDLANGEHAYYAPAGEVTDVLTGDLMALSDGVMLLHEKDYDRIKSQADGCYAGSIRLLDCRSQKESQRLGDALKVYFAVSNESGEDADHYSLYTKSDTITEDNQTNSFMLFVFSVMDFMLYLSALVMLHFRIAIHLEGDRKKYESLKKIGAASGDLDWFMGKEIKLMFLTPAVIALLGAALYGSALFLLSGAAQRYLFGVLVIGCLVIGVQVLLCRFYMGYCRRRFL
ncbi:MAG: hypothetical protein SOR93_12345 [Clostridiales Family XIII bacterium]|nr:hypothetical protein [Clostridia bacterium]MDE8732922.1 hypothetical protein [Eubacteriales bacterium DFI.9.88]MDY3012025.1 hypothetical protein [Clostridiales Family XIII bacterium]